MTLGSRPARWVTVQVIVVPGTVKLVDARDRPLLLTEVRTDDLTRLDLERRPVAMGFSSECCHCLA